ncbi:MAG: hypothetical protein M3O90_04765, partial [Actinomycetota bacterium]|nr:hypothetical protein [Actinomycetota bacterium]
VSRSPMAAPAAQGTSGQTLARAVGSEVGYTDAGAAEVVFPAPDGSPPPFASFSTAPRTVSRDLTDSEVATPPAPSSSGSTAPAAAPAPPPLDKDELYEEFVSRLRRDLLHEREQSGLLIEERPYR